MLLENKKKYRNDTCHNMEGDCITTWKTEVSFLYRNRFDLMSVLIIFSYFAIFGEY